MERDVAAALRIANLKNMTYRELTEMCLPQSEGKTKLEQQVANYLGINPTGRIMENLRYLGLFSKEKISDNADTVAAAMVHLIKEKLHMPPGSGDVVILMHEMDVAYPEERGRKEKLTTTMIEYGVPDGFTAIAKTVGMPIAIAAELLLTDRLTITGCQIPTHPAVYEPVLQELKLQGLNFQETVLTL